MKAKKIISVLLVISLLFAVFAIPAAAAKSGSNKTTKIYVTTKANWLKPGGESITLTPKAGEMKNGVKFTNVSWSVSVYKYGTGTVKNLTLKGNSSLKINLDRNASYQITVSPNPGYQAVCNTNKAGTGLKTYPSWYVSSTHKVSSIG